MPGDKELERIYLVALGLEGDEGYEGFAEEINAEKSSRIGSFFWTD